jgi:phage gp46-like protein
MIDILIVESGNGGDISLINGDIQSTDSLSNQAYLAHFGGNTEASTTNEEVTGGRMDWWGNEFIKDDINMQMNSELERTLNKVALTSSGRLKLVQAAKNDMDFLSNIAKIESEVSISGIDKVQISDKINQGIASFQWNATKNELIEEILI